MTDTTARETAKAEPVAFYCDHGHEPHGKSSHVDVLHVDGRGWVIATQPEIVSALESAGRDYLPENLRSFHCPAAVPLYRPDAIRDQVLTEAAEYLRSHSGDEWWFDPRDQHAAIGQLLAARTTTTQEP